MMPPSGDRGQEDTRTSHNTARLSCPCPCHVSGTVGGGRGDPEDRELSPSGAWWAVLKNRSDLARWRAEKDFLESFLRALLCVGR